MPHNSELETMEKGRKISRLVMMDKIIHVMVFIKVYDFSLRNPNTKIAMHIFKFQVLHKANDVFFLVFPSFQELPSAGISYQLISPPLTQRRDLDRKRLNL